MHRWAASVIVCCALVFAACSNSSRSDSLPPQTIAGSSKAYISIEALTEAADVVVTGVAGDVQERFADNGGDAVNPAVAALLQSFSVDRILKAPADLPDQSHVTLVLEDIDVSQRVDKRDSERIAPGDRLLLFLRSARGPVNGRLTTALIPLSGDNGMFDVTSDGTAKPRSVRVRAFTQAESLAAIRNIDSPTVGPITFSVDGIGQFVAGRVHR
jgi:hypothetical protein